MGATAPPPHIDRIRQSRAGGKRDRAESVQVSDTSDPASATESPSGGGTSEHPGARRRPRLARSTAIFSLATGLSRVLGLIRESVSAYYFGAGGKINAFTVAFQIPNLVRALVADAALSGAFVPVFSELLEKGERKRAWRVASTLLWLMLLALGGMTALFMLLSPFVLRLFGSPGGDLDLAVGLSRVLFPVVILLGLSGIVVGILNSYDHFAVPALTPVFWNAAIILGLVLGVPNQDGTNGKLYIYAGAILAATVIQLLLPVPWLKGLDGRLQLVLDWRDPAVRRVFTLMIPVTLGLGLINVNAVIDTVFASRLIDPKLAPTAIDKAFRLYMLPQGMFSVAVATVLFPALSRLAARADHDGFRDTVGLGIRQIGFLLIPAGVVSAVLAAPIVRLVYERGAFTPHQTTVVAGALAAFSLGLVFNGWMLILTRAFFSLQSNWIPTAIALGNLALNAALDAAFYPLGVWGIPLATSLVNVAGVAALAFFLRKRLGRLNLAGIGASVAQVVFASAVVAVVAFPVWYGLDKAVGRSLGGQILSLGIALITSGAAYVVACRALGVRELAALLALRRRSPEKL
jgi:putative peptidoglycan lipid II flippase